MSHSRARAVPGLLLGQLTIPEEEEEEEKEASQPPLLPGASVPRGDRRRLFVSVLKRWDQEAPELLRGSSLGWFRWDEAAPELAEQQLQDQGEAGERWRGQTQLPAPKSGGESV